MLCAAADCVMAGDDSCLTEINGFRAQDGLELKPFAALTNLTPSESTAISQGVTCEALRSGNAPFLVRLRSIFGPLRCGRELQNCSRGTESLCFYNAVAIPLNVTGACNACLLTVWRGKRSQLDVLLR